MPLHLPPIRVLSINCRINVSKKLHFLTCGPEKLHTGVHWWQIGIKRGKSIRGKYDGL